MINFTEKPKDNYLIVRPLTTRSLLPQENYSDKDGSFISREDVAFFVTRVTSTDEYYELGWSHPKEIALFSSLVIGAHPDYGKVFIYPVRWPLYVDDTGQDLSDKNYLEELADGIKRETGAKLGTAKQINPWEELPPAFIKTPYEINKNTRLDKNYQNLLFKSIDCDSDLLIRGLSHLLKSGMLSKLGRMFIDTACLELYVALEATLHIILSRLRKTGMSSPSNKDASDYLLDKFGESYRLDRYYQDFYDDRIKALHPNSRFGTAKFVPLYVDDLYMLYNDLLRNFEFLITNKPNCYKEFIEQIPNKSLRRTLV